MVKKIAVFIILLFCFKCGITQVDSIAVVSNTGVSERLGKGVSWVQIPFTHEDLFGANQNINIITISKKAKKTKLHIMRSDSLEKTSGIAMSANAIAAINGSFFKMRGPDPDHRKDLNGVPQLQPAKLDRNRSVVYFREKDSLISENIPDKDTIRKRHQQGAIVINKGKLSIVKNDPASLNDEHQLKGEDVISTGPVMILAGINQLIPNDAFCNDRHPRTAVGIKPDGTILLLVVDGRARESAGLSIPELQKLMQWLGCKDAINLDGGGSTAMYVKGEPYNGVVSHPSDNKKYDHEGEREVANAILLIKK